MFPPGSRRCDTSPRHLTALDTVHRRTKTISRPHFVDEADRRFRLTVKVTGCLGPTTVSAHSSVIPALFDLWRMLLAKATWQGSACERLRYQHTC